MSNDTSRVSSLHTTGKPPFLPWDNPDNILTLEQRELSDTIIHCALGPALCLVGVPANIISCIVFYKQGLRDRMNLCLFVLALVDAAHLLTSFTLGLYSFILFFDEAAAHEYYAKALVAFVFFEFAMRAASGCITMVVAVERCVCVVFPLRANSIMRTRTMGALLAAIIIFLTLGNSIVSFRNRVVAVYDEATGETYYQISVTDYFIEHHKFYDIFYDIILSFVVPIVTFVVVGVATAVTVLKLRTAIAWRASTSSGRGDNHSQQQQAALTKMLVILSCVFMVCSAPMTSLGIVRLLVPDFSTFGRYANMFFASHSICTFIVLINSAINFFVYYSRSSRFKQELHVLCCRGNVKKKVHSQSSDTKSMTTTTDVSEYSGISTGNGKAYSSPTIQAESAFLPWDNPDNIITLEQYEFTSTILYCALTPILFLVGVPTNIITLEQYEFTSTVLYCALTPILFLVGVPTNIITLEQYEFTSTILYCALTPILLLVGVPTNIISCLVFYKQGLRDRMNLCLFVLALVDTVYLASYSIVVYLTPIVFGLRAASGCITMVVAVERCVCVVFPLRANSIMRTRTMGALLAAIVIVMVLGFSFTIFRIKVEMVYDTTLGIKTHKVTMNEDFEKYDFILWDIVYTFIFGFLVPVVTFVVVGVATAITVIKLRTAIAWRASTSSGRGDNQNQQQQVALTKTLCCDFPD
nr:hypothetical protein BaRGS_002785 [Batillaria attramentaria]